MEVFGGDLGLPKESAIEVLYDKCLDGGDRLFYIDGETGKQYTFRDLYEGSVRVAHGINSLGLGKGDVVMVAAHQNWESTIVAFGTMFSGAVYNPVNPLLTADELAQMILTTKPKLIYSGFLNKALEAAGKGIRFLNSKGLANEVTVNGWLSTPQPSFTLPDIDSSTHVGNIMFTSGTTGFPKGIKLTDQSLFSALACSGAATYSKQSVPFLLTSPLFWASNTIFLCSCLINLNCLVVPPFPVDETSLVEVMMRYRPQSCFLSPALLVSLMSRLDIGEKDFCFLKSVTVGGSVVSKVVRLRSLERLFQNRLILKVGYGMTELRFISSAVEGLDSSSKEFESVGKIAKGVTLKIVDEITGKALGPGEQGEIWAKSPGMLSGVLHPDGTETSGTDPEGWLHTGDIGYYDSNKFLYIVGRLKNIMKYRGHQIAPAEIESVLYSHPDVVECCVLGTPDDLNVELPTAAVVKKLGSQTTEQELTDYVTSQVSDIKKLRGGVHFFSSLPKNSVGKILTREILNALGSSHK